ncbi:TRAP transporter small permease [Brevibacillus fulvus]|uniref:TRAP-type C4-dicarboxylate transport system permease small subunit n=1 Tax=Brevibacillus fulvus TaxID=1125967 RepID=A0A938Y1A1_9BACL|nr:TRAP transporter small permease [Brevibacillus fulvus]MBM7591343.1 TRAP-type C4-dicarboxylate transport system permease small subunit [Brevibacillus fulvus]
MLKRWLYSLDDAVAGIACAGVILLTFINVVARFIFNHPIGWAEEVTLGLFIWMVFIGMSSSIKDNGHIGVDYFVRKLPKPAARFMRGLKVVILYAVLLGIFVVFGYQLTEQAGSKITPVLGISYQYIDVAVPLGGILATIHYTISLFAAKLKKGENL